MPKTTTFPPADALDAKLENAGLGAEYDFRPVPPAQPPTRQAFVPSQPAGPLIYGKMIEVMRAVSHVGKDGTNTHFNYRFRGIDNVMNAVGPAMRQAGVFVTTEVLSTGYRDTITGKDKKAREVTVDVAYTFWAEDGSSVSATVAGESLDEGDKGTAKALSVAFRICLLQTFVLPTDEPTTDHDGHHHTRGGTMGMSKFEKGCGLAFLKVPTEEARKEAGVSTMQAAFVQAIDFADCLEEHQAWDQPADAPDGPTWGELFTARVGDEIEAADTGDEVMWLWQTLKANGINRDHGDADSGVLLKQRGAAIKERNAKAFDTIMRQITGAPTLEEMDPALASITWAADEKRITSEQAEELMTVHADRSRMLLNRTAGDGQPAA